MNELEANPIAFIGLGNMGGPMAINLVKAGYRVKAFDISAEARNKAAAGGVTIATSVLDASVGAKVVVSMLPASQHVEALYLGSTGDPGLLSELTPRTLVIDSSTIAPASARKVAEAAVAKGLLFLDAPVSGGTAGANAGTLTFMVGGSAEELEAATVLLNAMGSSIFHAGDHGAGQSAKLCNNMLLGILMIGTSEALSLGCSLGLDAKVLSEIMRRSSGGNWALEKYNPAPGVMDSVPASRGYSGGFGTGLMLKDLGLAVEAAIDKGASVPLGEHAKQLYEAHSGAGNRELDFSSIFRLVQSKV